MIFHESDRHQHHGSCGNPFIIGSLSIMEPPGAFEMGFTAWAREGQGDITFEAL